MSDLLEASEHKLKANQTPTTENNGMQEILLTFIVLGVSGYWFKDGSR